jgi:hypothetical protein
MSRSRNKRYYDDSDDMVERIRRTRESFEKKANAFQGPDWPYYDKRIIQGKKTKEEFLAAQAQALADPTIAPGSTETTVTLSQPNAVHENAPVTTADQTSSWWAAQREAQKTAATADTNDQSTKVTDGSDDKAIS